MLKLRRAEVYAQIEADTARLARIEARLRTIEEEDQVPLDGIVIKRLEPLRVAELTGRAAGYRPEAITPVIQPLYCDLWQCLAGAGVAAAGPALAYYDDAPEGGGAIVVHAAAPIATAAASGRRFSAVELAGVEIAAAVIHRGPMDDVLATDQGLARWIDANGYGPSGYAREVTLEWSPDPRQRVTELQQPIFVNGG